MRVNKLGQRANRRCALGLGEDDPVGAGGEDRGEIGPDIAAPERMIRTKQGNARASLSQAAIAVRAAGFLSGATESSTLRINASAPLAAALAKRSERSPGTNRRERSFMGQA